MQNEQDIARIADEIEALRDEYRSFKRRSRRAVWAGFQSVFLYLGAYLVLAPFWMKDWERPMIRLLSVRPRPPHQTGQE